MDQTGQKNNVVPGNYFLEKITMGGPGLTVVIDATSTDILFANKPFCESTGYATGTIINTPFINLLEPYQHERFRMQLAEIRYSRETSTSFVIYRLLTKAGIAQPFYIYAAPLSDDGAAHEMFQLLLLPDKSKNGMPFTSFETKERFLEHFHAEGFGTFEWIIDADKIFWSPGMYSICEASEDAGNINAATATNFVHPQDVAFVQECLENTLRDGGDMAIEYRLLTAKNNVKVVHSLAKIIKDSTGKPIKLVGSVRDVTKQRAIEDSLKNSVNDLHHSNRELEEFAYAASHDMQEPLRKITTFSDRLSEQYKDVLTGDGNMYLSRMAAAAENMRLLISGLLEFSKISKTATPYALTDLDSIVKQVTHELELKIEETGTLIHCTNLPKVDAVPSQMKQLFVNLIGNSIKFHKPGVSPVIHIDGMAASAVEVQAHSLEAGKTYHKIVIMDNGIGFEDEYATRIFQVFQRLHGKSEYPGSGIGLAICKKILEYHHGIIYAENADGAGARFVIIIPEAQ